MYWANVMTPAFSPGIWCTVNGLVVGGVHQILKVRATQRCVVSGHPHVVQECGAQGRCGGGGVHQILRFHAHRAALCLVTLTWCRNVVRVFWGVVTMDAVLPISLGESPRSLRVGCVICHWCGGGVHQIPLRRGSELGKHHDTSPNTRNVVHRKR